MKDVAARGSSDSHIWTGFSWLAAVSLVASLTLLGVGIVLTQGQLRTELRQQMAHRDAQTLAAIVQKQLNGPGEPGEANPLTDLLEALIVPDLAGVTDVQLYDWAGHATLHLLRDPGALPPSPGQIQAMKRRVAEGEIESGGGVVPVVAEFRETLQGALLTVLLALPSRPGNLPDAGLSSPALVAFTLDGTGLAAEYVRLDQTLRRRNWLVFGLLGATMSVGLGFSFHRLIRTQRLLQQRTARLEAANRELTLAAKTSAVGAVTAHLVHGLKNPLLGLQQFVQNLDSDGSNEGRADAAASARQMKSMIDDVVRVLRDEQGLTAFELSTTELLAHVHQRCSGLDHERGIRVENRSSVETRLNNRCANLAALILENLITNALQAVPTGGTVEVAATATPARDAVVFEVGDNGPGLVASVRERLFQPGTSTKVHGTGLGLALSQQLARSVKGELALAQSDARGTRFTLRIPTTLAETA